jgi:hypothetical protein
MDFISHYNPSMNTQTLSITDSKNLYKEYFREVGKLSKQAMEKKARTGDFPGCAPVGYLNKTEGERKFVIVDEMKAPLVQEAFRIAADGDVSLRTILKTVTQQGLTSRNGKPLGVSALWKILTNPFYTGKIRYGDELLPGNHTSIVSEENFKRVQKVLRSRCKTGNHERS